MQYQFHSYLKPASLMTLAVMTALPYLAYAEEAKPADETLPEVAVSAKKDQETALSHTFGYIAKRSTTATKTDTPIIETPQSISVITADQMQDQGAQSLQSILRYSAGVTADQYGLDARSDNFAIRGMDAVQYLDGLRRVNTYYTETTRPEAYALERVEILRGPSSMLFGAGGVGGTVNLVSKRPQEVAQHEVGISLGNNNQKQIQADLTGPVADTDHLFYRLVVLGRDADTQVNHVDDKRVLFAPSLTWKPSDKTSVTLLAQYQRNDTGSTQQFLPQSGVLKPNPNGKVAYDAFLSDPNFDQFATESNQFGWAVEHAFNDVWTVRQNLRYTSSKNTYNALYVNAFMGGADPFNAGTNQREINRYVDASKTDSKAFNVDNNAQAKFATGNVEHTTLLGLDYAKFRQHKSGYGDNALGNAIDIFNPVYNPVDFSNVVAFDNPALRQAQTGVYVQDQIKFDQHWIATLSLRHDPASTQTDGGDKQIDKKMTGRYGLTYLLDNGWAPYVSYAESFLPVEGVDKNGALFKPQEGEQWELGVKYLPEGSKTKFTAAIFDLKDKNRLTPDPTSPFDSVQKGEIRSRGLELEAAHTFDNSLDVIASYSYTDATYSKTNNATEKGNQVEAIPKNLASAWAIKGFNIGDTAGFRAGLGVRYIGASYDSTHVLKTPDATLFDALLGFDNGAWRFALNASNLFDKEYVSTCLSRGDCWLGAKRSAVASATYHW